MKIRLFCTIALSGLAFVGTRVCAADTAAAKPAAPHIFFETNFFDFGKVTAAEKLKGSFKFKNTGNADLHLESPTASCDCTEAKATPEIVAPGQTGEITYSIKMDHAVTGERTIHVHSDDPDNPNVDLTILLDYTPLFETTPPALERVILGPGKNETQRTFIVNRMDGKPLGIDRLATSQEWITAEFDPTYDPGVGSVFDSAQKRPESSARVIVTVKRPINPPTFYKEKIELWNGQQSDHAARVIEVSGQIMGEITADPARLEWAVADLGPDIKEYPAQTLTRHIKLNSALGRPVEFKKISTDVKGLSVKLVPTAAPRLFDLVIKFDELPHNLIDGKVTLETSLDSMPKLEVPLHIMAVP